jgi:hypothetical protein
MSESVRKHLGADCSLEVATYGDHDGGDIGSVTVECVACGVVVAELYNEESPSSTTGDGTKTWHLKCWDPTFPGKMDSGREEAVIGTLVTFDLEDGRHAIGLSMLAKSDNHSRRGGRSIAKERCLREVARATGELKPSNTLRPTKFAKVITDDDLRELIEGLKRLQRAKADRLEMRHVLRATVAG